MQEVPLMTIVQAIKELLHEAPDMFLAKVHQP